VPHESAPGECHLKVEASGGSAVPENQEQPGTNISAACTRAADSTVEDEELAELKKAGATAGTAGGWPS
jgi:hypothetical protein